MGVALSRLRNISVAAAMVAAMTVTLPAEIAHATNEVFCAGRRDFLIITWHTSISRGISCFANAGYVNILGGTWVDEISTGNNDIIYDDMNGDRVFIKRWTVERYWDMPRHVKGFTIL
ncbi:beta/gamma crystallin domain-containing protein [Thermopolyspora sp. NPDC052614]|uniref:beta/gamma crystallin domain-containing protein n=1 Tax=Thermopolyspora sp. NPDC052614 TaxID=3155682 RepID=UPI0034341321